MNYHIYNFESEFNFDKLIIGKKINNENISKYYIYYLDKIPKDLYIQIPSIRTIYNYQNIKFNQIKLPIYPIYDETIKLINFLKNLKKKIIDELELNKDFFNFMEKKDNLKILKFKLNENFNSLIKNIKNNTEIKALLNLSYIWENNNNFGLSITAVKLIVIPQVKFESIDFIDDKINDEKKIIKEPILNYNKEPIINYNKEPIINNNLEGNNKIFKLSPELLLQTKNKLISRI